MKKTTELKNLVFENILSESSKFIKPPEDSYIKTYPEFIHFVSCLGFLFLLLIALARHTLLQFGLSVGCSDCKCVWLMCWLFFIQFI